jgi:hypothetical protein
VGVSLVSALPEQLIVGVGPSRGRMFLRATRPAPGGEVS